MNYNLNNLDFLYFKLYYLKYFFFYLMSSLSFHISGCIFYNFYADWDKESSLSLQLFGEARVWYNMFIIFVMFCMLPGRVLVLWYVFCSRCAIDIFCFISSTFQNVYHLLYFDHDCAFNCGFINPWKNQSIQAKCKNNILL